MQRRSHKKSRGGCLQWPDCGEVGAVILVTHIPSNLQLTVQVLTYPSSKQRHVKCDEQHPTCRLCIVSERTCSFSPKNLRKGARTKAPTAGDPCNTSGERTSSEISCNTQSTTPTSQYQPPVRALCIASDGVDCSAHKSDLILDKGINLEHVELLLHFAKSDDLFSLGGDRVAHKDDVTLENILEMGVRYPYLLHQILAFSAQHLASNRPAKAAFHQHQAITLQTRAVSLFNASRAPVTKETCVPILLFSTVLGHQVLAETLSKRDARDLDAFLNQFIYCLETIRGVYVIFQEAKPFWKESVLGNILSVSSSLTSREPVGTQCDRIGEIVEASSRLTPDGREACQVAIRYLQVGFDAVLAQDEQEANRYQMLFLWCSLVPRGFIVLLSEKSVEALAILGYYAMLLRYGRSMWQVGDAGDYMLALLREILDAELEWDWQCW